MAVDQFLTLTDIEGESKDATYEASIDVLDWVWGVAQSGTMHMGGGGGSGKASFQDVSVTKYIDSSSHALLQCCSTGKHIPEGLLVIRKAGATPLEYIKLSMKNLIVSSISSGGNASDDRLKETVTLNFEEFKLEYVPQKEDGSGDAAKEFGFNIAKNETV